MVLCIAFIVVYQLIMHVFWKSMKLDIVWTEKDNATLDSYSQFNHVICFCVTHGFYYGVRAGAVLFICGIMISFMTILKKLVGGFSVITNDVTENDVGYFSDYHQGGYGGFECYAC